MIKETLELGGRSQNTIKKYTYAIKHFLNHYSEKTNISKFKEQQLIEYFQKQYLDKNCKTTTYNFMLATIRFFYSICFNRELNRRLLPKAKIARKLPQILDRYVFLSIFNNEKNIEHQCFLILGFCSGLRASEVASLRIENIDSRNHKLKVIGKGNKERYTILPDVVIKLLRVYYKAKNIKETSGYLFKGNNGNEHISPCTVENYFTNYANELGLDNGISFHTLRHSFATYFLMNGGDAFTLKDFLGHKSLSTTSIYIHLAHNYNNIKGINYAK